MSKFYFCDSEISSMFPSGSTARIYDHFSRCKPIFTRVVASLNLHEFMQKFGRVEVRESRRWPEPAAF